MNDVWGAEPLPNLTVAQLQYVVAAHDAETWAEAAAQLGVSQSALSQGLAELQRRLGVRIFERQGRRQVPLDTAEVVVDHARRVLGHTSDLREWAQQLRAGDLGRLRVGMIDVAAVDHFGEVLRTFRRRHPSLDLHLTVAPSSQLVGDLVRGALDLAVCVQPDHPDLTITPLLSEPLLVYPPDGSTTETWGPWVSFPAGSLTRDLIGQALAARGSSFEVVAESHQPEVLKEMVRLGMGWTVLPQVQAERAPAALAPVSDTPLLHRQLVAAIRTSAVHHPGSDLLIDDLHARL